MLTLHRSAVLALSGALLLFASASAQAQNATLTVYMKAGGSGAFANSTSTATAGSGLCGGVGSSKYNGSTNLYAPANKTLAGGTFNQAVTGLYSLAPGTGEHVSSAAQLDGQRGQTAAARAGDAQSRGEQPGRRRSWHDDAD